MATVFLSPRLCRFAFRSFISLGSFISLHFIYFTYQWKILTPKDGNWDGTLPNFNETYFCCHSFSCTQVLGLLSRFRVTWPSYSHSSKAADRRGLRLKVWQIRLLFSWSPGLHSMLLRYDIQQIRQAQRRPMYDALYWKLQGNLWRGDDELVVLHRLDTDIFLCYCEAQKLFMKRAKHSGLATITVELATKLVSL